MAADTVPLHVGTGDRRAAGGPLTFLAGERLGAVTLLPPLRHGLLRPSISWAVALVVFSAVVRRVTQERDPPRYRVSR